MPLTYKSVIYIVLISRWLIDASSTYNWLVTPRFSIYAVVPVKLSIIALSAVNNSVTSRYSKDAVFINALLIFKYSKPPVDPLI